MSELQAALLIIGSGVIVAVYAFGWWQQRQYRRKFGSAFKAGHEDALYLESATDAAEKADEATVGAPGTDAGVVQMIPAPDNATLLDGSCALLEARSDFIIEVRPAEPSPAAVLDGLWQRKFDFGKPVQVCGLVLPGKMTTARQWERAVAESQTLYERFRIALQLADRGGAISAARLADFRDLVLGIARQIKADITVPDIDETHRRAVELDEFCAEVDQMVGINLVPPGERLLPGAKIAQAAALHGMTLEADGAFHLADAQGRTVFSLINQDTRPFQHHTLETFKTPGITLLLDVPRVEHPAVQFDQVVRIAHELARELQVNLVDDHRMVLSDNGLARIRAQITEVEAKMCDNGIEPGSSQARRLFA